MPIPTTLALVKDAEKGKHLCAKERRQCVVYLKATAPEKTNTELAQLFGVTERTIRMDLQSFRKEKAKFIKEDDVGLIIADIALDYERQIRDIERSKAKAQLGSRTYLSHCTEAMELRIKMVKALQDLGYYPKNLGNMTIEKFDFKAEVRPDGSVQTRPVDWLDGKDVEVIEGELIEQKALPEPNATDNEETRLRAADNPEPDRENQASPVGVTEAASETERTN